MKAQRARRFAAVSAVGVLLAGGATIATAGTASAATPNQVSTQISTNRGCYGGWGNCYGYGGFGNRNFFGNGFYGGYGGYGGFGYPYGFNSGGVVVVLVG